MANHILLHLLFLFLLLPPFSTIKDVMAGGYFPASPMEYRLRPMGVADAGGSRRKLEPFQLCLECRCCAASDPTSCSSMPCCFGIDCNIPDKPYGVCAFVPKTCNCTSCV